MAANIRFAPRESFLVVFSDHPSSLPVYHPTDNAFFMKLHDGWNVWFNHQLGGKPTNGSVSRNAGEVGLDTLYDWTQHSDPRIRYYSGTAIYKNSFTLKTSRKATYRLSLPLLNSVAEVIVNGQSAGIVWCSPWDIDITQQLRKGKNRIELRVCNTLWNRLVGDASLPERERITWQTTPLAKSTDSLVPSGFSDDVVIISYKK